MRTNQISRQHAKLFFTADGIVWENLACQNGTVIAGQHVAANASHCLRQFSEVRIADVVRLSCELFCDDPTDGDDNYAEFERDMCARTSDAPLGTVRAARLSRNDALSALEEYVLFQRAITIGSSPTCPIRIAHRSISPVHAQIVFLAGSLWLEPCQQNRPTLVDGEVLRLHRLAPLRPNLPLQLGEIELLVTQYQQFYLDTMPG